MRHPHSIVGHFRGEYSEQALQRWAEELRSSLPAPLVSLGLVFLSPRFFPNAAQILEILRVHACVPLLLGCSSQWLIAGSEELQESPGLVLGLYHLPGASLTALYFTQAQIENFSDPDSWHLETRLAPRQTNGWLVFADPFTLEADRWLEQWNQSYPGQPVQGGLASCPFGEQETQVYLNGEVYQEGGVVLSIGGEVELSSVISQGCTPIGETWTITRAEGNLIYEIANRPAYEVLLETYAGLSTAEQKKSQGNLFIGLVMNEYLEEFHRGDFLVRNLIGVDAKAGVIAVGATPRTGQTMQFQRRDPKAAEEDLTELLEGARLRLANRTIYGGCLCSCNGRGVGLFGQPHHDATLIQRELGPLGLSGFFCNGELGPVGGKNFLHGYTASLALFVKKGLA